MQLHIQIISVIKAFEETDILPYIIPLQCSENRYLNTEHGL